MVKLTDAQLALRLQSLFRLMLSEHLPLGNLIKLVQAAQLEGAGLSEGIPRVLQDQVASEVANLFLKP